ncbi:hypothetical protein CI610_00374 [invertebrate metagenome]|uniref:Uncharacterized protein n=1 Tax=invertebrate metagenome TaxID=1711999 RepID=A0A2H9TBK9_9ZZZZ
MKNPVINDWIELKKNSRNFETVLNCKNIIKKSTPWNDMALFFREADKHINK